MFYAFAQTYHSGSNMVLHQGQTSQAQYAVVIVAFIILFLLSMLAIVGMWKMFQKAGKPGWAALVPFYNNWVLAEVAGKPGWWSLLLLIPLVNIVVTLLISIEIAHRFGRSTMFGILALWLFNGIGYCILGFGPDTYHANGLSHNFNLNDDLI